MEADAVLVDTDALVEAVAMDTVEVVVVLAPVHPAKVHEEVEVVHRSASVAPAVIRVHRKIKRVLLEILN